MTFHRLAAFIMDSCLLDSSNRATTQDQPGDLSLSRVLRLLDACRSFSFDSFDSPHTYRSVADQGTS